MLIGWSAGVVLDIISRIRDYDKDRDTANKDDRLVI